ncbi:MAG: hypothetical protein HY332_12100 [Chloroflexi bacterium]|nr:hypothetical protein [Chloroflexota bacterium]
MSFDQPVGPGDRVSRSDIAYLYLPQSRTLGEPDPPQPEPHRRVEVPAYTGSFLVRDARMPSGEVQVWPALAVVVMDSCELDRYYNQGRSRERWDSRVAVAPIVFEEQYPHGSWGRMAQGRTPLYGFYLEPLSAGVVGSATWTRALVDLRGTTLVSRRQVELNRRLRLAPEPADALAFRVLEFWYLREVARQRDLEARRGKRIRDLVPVQSGEDHVELRVFFEDAEPLRVICRTDQRS